MIAQEVQTKAFRFAVERDGKEVGYAYLHIMSNDTHEKPYGYFADLVVEESYRAQGIGSELIQAVVQKAEECQCYKLIGTSRNTRPQVHEWYERVGFDKYGAAFRMDFKK